MRVLVTGSSGFIGSHLVPALNQEVTGYDLSPSKHTTITGDINDTTLLKKTLRGIDVVYHLASLPIVADSSRFPEKFFETNTRGTFSLLLAAKKAGVKRFVFASSSAVYGPVFAPSSETDPVNPVSIYAADKAAGEAYCSAFSTMETVVLRLFNIYGPGTLKGVMHDFTRSLLSSPKLEILGDGSQSKDFCHISDAVSALKLALTLPSGTYNVGSGVSTPILSLVKTISDELGVSPELSFTQESWPGDVFFSQADISKLSAHGWKPKVDLQTGLREYVRWLKSLST